ncbi:unnamed protein product, partial [Brassica oleracea]
AQPHHSAICNALSYCLVQVKSRLSYYYLLTRRQQRALELDENILTTFKTLVFGAKKGIVFCLFSGILSGGYPLGSLVMVMEDPKAPLQMDLLIYFQCLRG